MGEACEKCTRVDQNISPAAASARGYYLRWIRINKIARLNHFESRPEERSAGAQRSRWKFEKKLTRVVEAGLELGLVEGPVGLRHLHLRHVDTGPQQAVRLEAVGLREARTKAGGARAHPRRAAHRVGHHARGHARPRFALAAS
jgi:hypothetical protein